MKKKKKIEMYDMIWKGENYYSSNNNIVCILIHLKTYLGNFFVTDGMMTHY